MFCTDSTMMPKNFLSGLSQETDTSDAEAAASPYARAAVSDRLTQGRLPGLASAAAPNAALLDSMIAQEERKQAILASQLSALGPNAASMPAIDALGVALMMRRNLEQQAALAGSLPATSADALGFGGWGLNSVLFRGILPGTAMAQQSLLLGQPQLGSLPAGHLMPQPASAENTGSKTGRTGTFPQKLHLMLSDLEKEEGGKEIASFLPHGRSFAIHKPKDFVKKIMHKYFRMSRFSSFQRQLNLYEFHRIREGPEKGAYFHDFFIQGRPMLCTSINRTKIKGAAATRPNQYPMGPGVGIFGPGAQGATSAYLGSLGGKGGQGV
jgi:hypothetical protein